MLEDSQAHSRFSSLGYRVDWLTVVVNSELRAVYITERTLPRVPSPAQLWTDSFLYSTVSCAQCLLQGWKPCYWIAGMAGGGGGVFKEGSTPSEVSLRFPRFPYFKIWTSCKTVDNFPLLLVSHKKPEGMKIWIK